jgi:hypothetical protein
MTAETAAKIFEYLTSVDATLSRTAIGNKVSTAASPLKKKALLSGNALSSQLENNRRLIAEYIEWRVTSPPKQEADFLESLLSMAGITGLRLFPEGIFRLWPYVGSDSLVFPEPDQVAPHNIYGAVVDFCFRSYSELNRASDADTLVKILAGIEWDIAVGPIHPFYDACGRISRYYTTLLSLWYSAPIVDRGTREGYFQDANEGREDFQRLFAAYPRLPCT